jgi:cytochrome b
MEKVDRIIIKVFKWIFVALFITAIIAVCAGATHQWVMASICGIMALILHLDNKKNAQRTAANQPRRNKIS